MRQSFFDGFQRKFWDKGDKTINSDKVYVLKKLKNNDLKDKNYSIDLKLHLFKKIKTKKNNTIIYRTFKLVITTYKVIDVQQGKLKNSHQNLMGFEFCRNQKTFQIFTQDKLIHQELDLIFQGLCVLTDFHQKYERTKVIGNGSFGQLFQAKKRDNSQVYAVKGYLKSYLQQQPKLLLGLINEIQIMKQLDCSSLLKLEQVYESQNTVYLVFESHSGGHLLSRFQQKQKIGSIVYQTIPPRLSQKIVSQIMKNLINATHHMHKMNIMHRNIKPENVIFRNQTDHTDVILTEFGYADCIKKPKMIYKRCGTPGFVAPEVLSYRVGDLNFYNQKCDVFSLGTIFYVLLTGQNPFNGEDQDQLIQQNIACDLKFDHPALKNRPDSTIDLLRQMLAVSPDERISLDDAMIHLYFNSEIQSQYSQINTFSYQNASLSKSDSRIEDLRVGYPDKSQNDSSSKLDDIKGSHNLSNLQLDSRQDNLRFESQNGSSLCRSNSRLENVKVRSSLETSPQFLSIPLQRSSLEGHLLQQQRSIKTRTISNNELFQNDENFFGYESFQRVEFDSQGIKQTKSTFDDVSPNGLKKSTFQRYSLQQEDEKIFLSQRSLTNEMLDFNDEHDIQKKMTHLNNYTSKEFSDLNCDINCDDSHSASNVVGMDFSSIFISIQCVPPSSSGVWIKRQSKN